MTLIVRDYYGHTDEDAKFNKRMCVFQGRVGLNKGLWVVWSPPRFCAKAERFGGAAVQSPPLPHTHDEQIQVWGVRVVTTDGAGLISQSVMTLIEG